MDTKGTGMGDKGTSTKHRSIALARLPPVQVDEKQVEYTARVVDGWMIGRGMDNTMDNGRLTGGNPLLGIFFFGGKVNII